MMTKPSLAERACRALGWEPRISWWISRDGGKSMAMEFHSEEVARTWLQRYAYGVWADYAVCQHELWPAIDTDWAVAGRALEEMVGERDWPVSIKTYGGEGEVPAEWWCAMVWGDGRPPFVGKAATGPEAIARAIVSALEVRNGSVARLHEGGE